MRIIAFKRLRSFFETYPVTEQALRAWYSEAKQANWESPNDLKSSYPNVKIVGDRAIFKIKGNQYRLVVKINYKLQIVYIRFIGSHQEYDKIDVLNI